MASWMPCFWRFRPICRKRRFPAKAVPPFSVWNGSWRSCAPNSAGGGLSGDVPLRFRAAHAYRPAAAETHPQRKLRHFDLGACAVGQVFVVSAHRAAAGTTRTVRFRLPAGTVHDGLRRIEPMLQPIYEAFCARNRAGEYHQADETRWLVFVLLDGKKGYGCRINGVLFSESQQRPPFSECSWQFFYAIQRGRRYPLICSA
jgi:hypothetical protein